MPQSIQSPLQSKNLTNTLLVLTLIIASGLIGHLWTKSQYLEKGIGNVAGAGTGAAIPTQAALPTEKVGDVDPINDDDLVRGNPKAKVALVEWSDLECPFCSSFHPTAKKVVEEYGDKVVWVYRHFPLTQIHPKAQKFAEATECVKKISSKDKAWEFIDTIFADQSVTLDQLPGIVSKLGVNQSKFDSCLKNDESKSAIEAQANSGTKAGVTGTPGNIVINFETGEAKLIPGAVPFEQVKIAIDSLL